MTPAATAAAWRMEPPARVCDLIARAALGDDDQSTLGEVTLLPHQRAAVRVLRGALARFGGAVLADEVGLGKTFTALAVARRFERPLLAAPASLRAMWRSAMARTARESPFVSYEQLSAGHEPPGAYDLVVLDEAHHARTPSTRRYRTLARLTRGARVLLVSATPVHNRRRDLEALLAFFLGSGASEVSDEMLAQIVCRQRAPTLDRRLTLPELRPLVWQPVRESPRLLDAIQRLPPPLPPADGGHAHALTSLSLLRAWCSSDAALRAALRRRLEVSVALEHALTHGRHPTRAELLAWGAVDGAVQLAFPELVSVGTPLHPTDALLECVRTHARALRELRDALDDDSARDAERFGALARIVGRHSGRRILVFTHSADTAKAAYRSLLGRARVACLTGDGGRIASGSISREELLRAFAPAAPRGPPLQPASVPSRPLRPPPGAPALEEEDAGGWLGLAGCGAPSAGARAPDAGIVDVLVATDVLSEGVDLQLASVVVHLDLPWTMARLEQRVGRVRRIGAPHAEVFQYAVAPPANAGELAAVARHLVTKARLSQALVGASGTLDGAFERTLLRDGTPGATGASPPDAIEALRVLVRGWRRMDPEGLSAEVLGPSSPPPETGEGRVAVPVAACIGEGGSGVVAVLSDADGLLLVAGPPAAPSADAGDVLRLAESARARAPAARPSPGQVRGLLDALGRWCAGRDVTRDALASVALRTPVHRAFARYLAGAVTGAPRHLRPALAPRVQAVRELVRRSVGAGAEVALRALLSRAPAPSPEDGRVRDWLDEVSSALEPHVPPARVASPRPTRVTALLIVTAGS